MSTTETQAPPAAGTGPRKLVGRVAFVTGGTRGIGAAISQSRLARRDGRSRLQLRPGDRCGSAGARNWPSTVGPSS